MMMMITKPSNPCVQIFLVVKDKLLILLGKFVLAGVISAVNTQPRSINSNQA